MKFVKEPLLKVEKEQLKVSGNDLRKNRVTNIESILRYKHSNRLLWLEIFQ